MKCVATVPAYIDVYINVDEKDIEHNENWGNYLAENVNDYCELAEITVMKEYNLIPRQIGECVYIAPADNDEEPLYET